MNGRLLRTFALLLLAVILATALVSCDSQGTAPPVDPTQAAITSTPKPTTPPEPTPAEPVTITSLHSEGTIPSENPSIPQAVRDRTGIDWQPILVGPGEYETKLSAMIAGQNLPDIFSYGIVDGKKYVDNGMIVPLNDLLAEYGQEVLRNHEGMWDQGLNAGGTTWGIPQPAGYPATLAVRTDWLKNLDLKMPTDIESFKDVMQAFTQDDPDQDGQKDTIGLASCIAYDWMYTTVMGAFGIPYRCPIMVDGTVTTVLKHPNYLQAITYFRELYDNGWMEPDFATIPNMACLEKLWNGTYGAIDFSPVGTTNNWLGRYTEDPKPTFGYTTLAGPGGSGGMLQPRSSGYAGISASCEYPEVAMQLINFLGSPEGDELLYFGIEGKHFEWIDKAAGTFKYLPPYDDSATQRADGGYIYWILFRRANDNTEILAMNQITRDALQLSASNYLPDAYIYAQPAIAESLGTNLSDIEKEAFANLVVTTNDLQTELNGYIARWMAEGGETWEQQATEIYSQEN